MGTMAKIDDAKLPSFYLFALQKKERGYVKQWHHFEFRKNSQVACCYVL